MSKPVTPRGGPGNTPRGTSNTQQQQQQQQQAPAIPPLKIPNTGKRNGTSAFNPFKQPKITPRGTLSSIKRSQYVREEEERLEVVRMEARCSPVKSRHRSPDGVSSRYHTRMKTGGVVFTPRSSYTRGQSGSHSVTNSMSRGPSTSQAATANEEAADQRCRSENTDRGRTATTSGSQSPQVHVDPTAAGREAESRSESQRQQRHQENPADPATSTPRNSQHRNTHSRVAASRVRVPHNVGSYIFPDKVFRESSAATDTSTETACKVSERAVVRLLRRPSPVAVHAVPRDLPLSKPNGGTKETISGYFNRKLASARQRQQIAEQMKQEQRQQEEEEQQETADGQQGDGGTAAAPAPIERHGSEAHAASQENSRNSLQNNNDADTRNNGVSQRSSQPGSKRKTGELFFERIEKEQNALFEHEAANGGDHRDAREARRSSKGNVKKSPLLQEVPVMTLE